MGPESSSRMAEHFLITTSRKNRPSTLSFDSEVVLCKFSSRPLRERRSLWMWSLMILLPMSRQKSKTNYFLLFLEDHSVTNNLIIILNFSPNTTVSKQYHAIPCSTMQYQTIPCDTMQY